MRSMHYLNTILTVLTVLLALHCWVLLAGAPTSSSVTSVSTAHAQGVGGAAQRQVAIVDQLKALNKTVESLNTQVKSGIKVQVTSMPSGD